MIMAVGVMFNLFETQYKAVYLDMVALCLAVLISFISSVKENPLTQKH